MGVRKASSWLAAMVVLTWVMTATVVFAQQAPWSGTPEEASEQMPHDMAHMLEMMGGDPNPMSREGSGTSWLPVASPMYGVQWTTGPWQWMLHGDLVVQYFEDAGPRGHAQAGSVNWLMLGARRAVGAGRIGWQAMVSAEPITIRGCGYPDLLASGELCGGESIVDQQHPHDAFMEVAATYDRPLAGQVRWLVYGGPVGEPALGPGAFPHRPSAFANPLAPITHHWLDSTHVSFGVVTTGVYGRRWKVEASAFNGREPDEHRGGIDLAPLDSGAVRVTVAPSDQLTLQVSVGRLHDAEPAHGFEPAYDVTRVTASALIQRPVTTRGWWASTLAWGRNDERGGATHAVLGETSLTVDEKQTIFGRVEVNGKEAHDLSLHGPRQVFTVMKLQGGFMRYIRTAAPLQTGIGVTVSSALVPEPLRTVFGGRWNGGFGVFVSVRPARHRM